ncbi:hypothetical protein B0T25DRAFT_264283 [Lasiosphaeria hispida]|uniref:Uncharacterized protein n=1 Tax=Lasiosphaeria hispida TaxID=260671 RepID=A0AAJ0HAK6_9PEZI|nr:hypothetical protein B0T25DRAFT_264283 [Lasiosphaeria hispida]
MTVLAAFTSGTRKVIKRWTLDKPVIANIGDKTKLQSTLSISGVTTCEARDEGAVTSLGLIHSGLTIRITFAGGSIGYYGRVSENSVEGKYLHSLRTIHKAGVSLNLRIHHLHGHQIAFSPTSFSAILMPTNGSLCWNEPRIYNDDFAPYQFRVASLSIAAATAATHHVDIGDILSTAQEIDMKNPSFPHDLIKGISDAMSLVLGPADWTHQGGLPGNLRLQEIYHWMKLSGPIIYPSGGGDSACVAQLL